MFRVHRAGFRAWVHGFGVEGLERIGFFQILFDPTGNRLGRELYQSDLEYVSQGSGTADLNDERALHLVLSFL